MEKQIYSPNLGYSAFLYLTTFAIRCHYRSITLRGYDNLPNSESFILAPCHQQALMDPLVLLTKEHRPIVFLARADVFAKPTIRKILTWLKMMPIYRIRDGKESLEKNAAIFDRCCDVLLHRTQLCLMAEGRHNNKHQLLPLVKGMFRIAGETQQQLGDRPLYIVPVGLDYDDYEQPYSNAIINIGKPIDIRPFAEIYRQDEPKALNQMRDALSTAIKSQMHHIASTEHYEAFEAISRIALHPMMTAQHRNNNSWNRFETRRDITARLDTMEQATSTDSEQAQRLERILALADEHLQICRRSKISVTSNTYLKNNHSPVWELTLIGIATLIIGCILQPWVLWGVLFALLCFPLTIVPTHLIARKLIKDPQFRSTANFGIRYGFTLVYSPILIITVLCRHGILWASITLAMICIMGRMSGYLTCVIRRFLTETKLNIHTISHRKDYSRIEQIEKDLVHELKKS